MQSFRGSIRWLGRHTIDASSKPAFTRSEGFSASSSLRTLSSFSSRSPSSSHIKIGYQAASCNHNGISSNFLLSQSFGPGFLNGTAMVPKLSLRCLSTMGNPVESVSQDASASVSGVAPRIKFKRLDKTARHIMQILDKEAVEEVREQREVPDIRPGYIIQLKVEVPENKRRVSTIKGIVIARRNAGLNSTFRIRRQVAGVGVEYLFPLYSPNIKEIKVLDKKKVRRAKLYYLRDKMNALKK